MTWLVLLTSFTDWIALIEIGWIPKSRRTECTCTASKDTVAAFLCHSEGLDAIGDSHTTQTIILLPPFVRAFVVGLRDLGSWLGYTPLAVIKIRITDDSSLGCMFSAAWVKGVS